MWARFGLFLTGNKGGSAALRMLYSNFSASFLCRCVTSQGQANCVVVTEAKRPRRIEEIDCSEG